MRRVVNQLSREATHRNFKLELLRRSETELSPCRVSLCNFSSLLPSRIFQIPKNPDPKTAKFAFDIFGLIAKTRVFHSVADSGKDPCENSVTEIQNILKNHGESSVEEIELALDRCGIVMTQELVLDLLNRNRSYWKPAYIFFKWVSKGSSYLPGTIVYNEILDILGRMRRFEELHQLFDEMSTRDGLVDSSTFGVLLNRYAAARNVDEAVGVYKRWKDFGIKDDLVAFQNLLLWLCRYKHVEFAETLFCSRETEFGSDIKTRNIILNGWCVLGNVSEAKRFWKDIIASGCVPDSFTYSIFINALTKKGKLGTAMELFRAMLDKGCNFDVKIWNNMIDALCFKKKIPKALELLKEMIERGCSPDVSTYNSLIKHMCKIQRLDKVYELLEEMETKKGNCLPNDITFGYLLKSSKNPEEVSQILERMARNECKMSCDLYNLVLKLYMVWNYEDRVRCVWEEMEKSGFRPDQRSYTILIHGLYDKGKIEDALFMYNEMMSKGMLPEPRTQIIVEAMKTEPVEGRREDQGKKGSRKNNKSQRSRYPSKRKIRK